MHYSVFVPANEALKCYEGFVCAAPFVLLLDIIFFMKWCPILSALVATETKQAIVMRTYISYIIDVFKKTVQGFRLELAVVIRNVLPDKFKTVFTNLILQGFFECFNK